LEEMPELDRESSIQREYWESQDAHGSRRSPDHPVVAAFAGPKLALAAQHGVFDEGALVLDVGCGNGFFTSHLPEGVRAVGIDLSGVMLRLNPNPRLAQASALVLPLADGAFDTVFCSNLLHHLPDPQEAVREMGRVSRRFVVLSEPNRNNPGMMLLGLLRRAERGTLKYTTRYLRQLAAGAGLQVRSCRALGMVFPNVTPTSLLPLFQLLDGIPRLGAYILMVAEKAAA
jgi:SAM-dependent methyltransferase